MAETRTYQGHTYQRSAPGEAWSLVGPSAAPAAPVLASPPKLPTPIDPLDATLKGIQINKGQADLATVPYDAAKAAADARAAAANATIAETKAAQGPEKSATQIEIESKAEGTSKRAMTARKLIDNVRALYEKDIHGRPIFRGFGLSEYIDALPENERFTAAGRNILPLIRPLVAQTAKEGDSDREMAIFESYVPTADDSDMTIEGKLNSLDILIGGMVDGKLPSETQAEMVSAGANTQNGVVTIGGKEYTNLPGKPPAPNGGASGGPSLGQAFKAGIGDIVQFAGDTIGLVSNPANAIVNEALGTDLTTDMGRYLRDKSGLPDGDPIISAINRAAASGLTLGAGAGALASRIPGATGAALEVAGQQPIRQAIGAATGSAAAEKARQDGASPLAQVGLGLAGGVAGYSGANALANVANRAAGAPNALMAAAQRQNVQLLPADVGGTATQKFTAGALQGPLSASPIAAASRETMGGIRSATARAARSQGDVLEPDIMGEQIREAGNLYVKRETQRIGSMYTRAKEASRGVRIKPLGATAEIDGEIARLGKLEETNAPMIAQLEKLKRDIADGLDVEGLRDARTALSQGVYDGKLRSGQEKAMYKGILDKMSQDIEAGLVQAGRQPAARAFRRADQLWRARIEQIDEVLEPVIGKGKSGEDALNAVERMARGSAGGVKRLSGLLREMPEVEAGNLRATVIDRLGKATAGQQDDTGGAFSASTFLTNWNRMSPRGKAALFGNDQLRRNLDDIAKLTDASKSAARHANHSNSGNAVTVQGLIGGGAIYADPTLTIPAIVLGSQYATGRLLASRHFTAWLARAPRNPAAQGRYIEQLGTLAAKEPAIADEARGLQQYLAEQFAKSPGRAAAEDTSDRGREPPR